MSQKGHTKEERFLLALYEKDEGRGAHDCYDIGESIGLHPRGIKTICRDLLQCNFIKKAGGDHVTLTNHGKNLVMKLIEE